MQNPIAAAEEVHALPSARPFTADLLRTAGPIALLVSSFALLYVHVVVKLVHDWATDDNASHGFLIVPLAAYLYTVSTMHCMSVSLGLDGAGLGTVWGRQLATSMLADAGFGDVAVREIETDPINFYYVAHK